MTEYPKTWREPGIAAVPRMEARSKRFFFSSNGFRGPTERRTLGAGGVFGVSEKWFVSDPYWTFSPKFLICNWYMGTGNAGNQEVANGNAVTIEDMSISISGGAPTRLTFDGLTGITLADDSEAWNDDNMIAIPPNTLCCVRLAWSVANSAHYISAPSNGLSPMFKDKIEVGTSSLAAKVMAGGISTTLPSGAAQYGLFPHAMVAQGNDGRPVGLILGTSIEQGIGQSRFNRSKHGELGPWGLGMCSTFGGAPRFPAAVFAVSGGFAAGITAKATGLAKRFRAFSQLPNVPFTFIGSGFGTNDQTATYSTWKSIMQACWSAIREAWPRQKLIQSTMWPRVTSTDAFATVANQTLSSNWAFPAGSAWTMYQFMLNLGDGLLDAVIDLQDTIDNLSGGGTRGKWRADTVPAWATTLSANRQAADTSMTLAAQPRPGAILRIGDGTQEAVISQSVSSTAAPFTVSLLTSIAGSHTAGAAVSEVMTQDGVHPGDYISQFVADRKFAAEKLSGVFG